MFALVAQRRQLHVGGGAPWRERRGDEIAHRERITPYQEGA